MSRYRVEVDERGAQAKKATLATSILDPRFFHPACKVLALCSASWELVQVVAIVTFQNRQQINIRLSRSRRSEQQCSLGLLDEDCRHVFGFRNTTNDADGSGAGSRVPYLTSFPRDLTMSSVGTSGTRPVVVLKSILLALGCQPKGYACFLLFLLLSIDWWRAQFTKLWQKKINNYEVLEFCLLVWQAGKLFRVVRVAHSTLLAKPRCPRDDVPPHR